MHSPHVGVRNRKHPPPQNAGHCDAPLLADTDKQTLEIRDSFWFMGHFSRHVPRGSRRVAQDGLLFDAATTHVTSALLAFSALTPAGDLVAVVLNTDETQAAAYQWQLADGSAYANVKIPPHGIQTLTLRAAK